LVSRFGFAVVRFMVRETSLLTLHRARRAVSTTRLAEETSNVRKTTIANELNFKNYVTA
jgi:hypothetical protein